MHQNKANKPRFVQIIKLLKSTSTPACEGKTNKHVKPHKRKERTGNISPSAHFLLFSLHDFTAETSRHPRCVRKDRSSIRPSIRPYIPPGRSVVPPGCRQIRDEHEAVGARLDEEESPNGSRSDASFVPLSQHTIKQPAPSEHLDI